MIDIDKAKNVFKDYVKNYDSDNGMIKLKIAHTLRVADYCKKTAQSLNLNQEDVALSEIIGLLHDIGRFEQIRKYNTFVDADSENHAKLGLKVLFEENLIEQFDINPEYYELIKIAIDNHNKGRIDKGLNERQILFCKIIRDSDKLDIFHVLLTDDFINTYGCDSLKNETFTDEIVREFKDDQVIDYKKRKTFGDKWICHMAYVYDLYFKNSYAIVKENDYFTKLLKHANFKNEETKVQAEEITQIANRYVEQACK